MFGRVSTQILGKVQRLISNEMLFDNICKLILTKNYSKLFPYLDRSQSSRGNLSRKYFHPIDTFQNILRYSCLSFTPIRGNYRSRAIDNQLQSEYSARSIVHAMNTLHFYAPRVSFLSKTYTGENKGGLLLRRGF